MLRNLKDLEGYSVNATDADIGHVVDFLLDDEQWFIRYLVVETGGFLGGRHRVLISPISFRQVDWSTRRFHVALTTAKVKGSPSINLDKPVSRQHEQDYQLYYGYPYYWGFGGAWGFGAYPSMLASGLDGQSAATTANKNSDGTSGDVHLRSFREICGYHIQAQDEAIGHVANLIVDDATWAVRYLVVDTSNWWMGKKVLIAPHWATSVSWDEKQVHVELTRDAIKASPPWSTETAVNREYEARLYDYYGRPVYWADDGRPRALDPSPRHERNHPG
jgi:hypothetical protein